MLFNPDDFRARKKDIIKILKRNKISSGSISEYAALAGIPITVICTFIIEEMPEYTEMCEKKIKGINDFYGF